MATAKQLPSGNWRIQVYAGKDADGNPKYISITKPSEKEAKYAALEYQLHYKEIENNISNITLKEAISRYIESKDAVLSPSTVSEYKNEQKNHLQGLMNTKIGNLTQEMIQKEINKEAKLYSPKTVHNIHCLLSAVLKECRPNFTLRTILPQKIKNIVTIPEPEEIQSILKAVNGTKIELPVLLALCLGLRRSEICGLKWESVDFEHKLLTVKSAIVSGENGKLFEKSPKSYAGTRVLPVPDYVVELLEQQGKINDYVVPLRGDYIYKSFAKILKANNINHIRFHDLRHANASLMLALNVPDKYAMERMGHATNSVIKIPDAERRGIEDEGYDGGNRPKERGIKPVEIKKHLSAYDH